jgi:hypothetical protein
MPKPKVTITAVARIEAGIPFLRKSLAAIYLCPSLFSCAILVSQTE